MTFLEILGLIASGAATTALILGGIYAWYIRSEERAMREFLAKEKAKWEKFSAELAAQHEERKEENK